MVCLAAETLGSEDFCSAISAVGTTHDKPPFIQNEQGKDVRFDVAKIGRVPDSLPELQSETVA